MKLNQTQKVRGLLLFALLISLTGLSSQIKADTGTCGGVTITLPFNDVMASPFFCQIAAAYYSGLTNGTTATTYSPTQTVTREQMAAFISRTMDQSLKRGSRRAIAKKWWTPQTAGSLGLTDVGASPTAVEFDGTDLWVANISGSIMRVRPGDGKVVETWTGATSPVDILCAMGRIFIVGQLNPGRIYMIDPTQPPGVVTTLTTGSVTGFTKIAFDGARIWVTSQSSVSIVSLNPATVTTVSTSPHQPNDILYDGASIWVTDINANALLKLNADGSVAQTVGVGGNPEDMVFDGTNIWVVNRSSNSVSVVRVKDAAGNPLASPFVLTTLTTNELSAPLSIAFDGERILVTNLSANFVSMWKAADLTQIGAFPVGTDTQPTRICSDGLNFWFLLQGTGKLARF